MNELTADTINHLCTDLATAMSRATAAEQQHRATMDCHRNDDETIDRLRAEADRYRAVVDVFTRKSTVVDYTKRDDCKWISPFDYCEGCDCGWVDFAESLATLAGTEDAQ